MQIVDNGDFITYKDIKVVKGQLGDFAAEWWTQADWEKWNKQVSEWKADGTYGEVSYISIEIKKNLAFDNPPKIKNCLTSHRLVFLDNDYTKG